MTVGDVRVAIRRMLRVPHPRERKARWIWLATLAGIALLLQLVLQDTWPGLAIAAGGLLGVAALFTLLGRLWGWTVLAVGLGAGLGLVPLFGVLGLELSLAVALFASIMGADLGSALARELARMPAEGVMRAAYPGRSLARGSLAAAVLAVGITLVPGMIAAVRGIVVPTCDWVFGIESYLAMPIASAALAGAIGHAMGALVGPRRFLGAAVAQLPAIVVAAGAIWRFHASPPVYTYNAILGYFPGNMYDENVRLGTALLWSRLEQIAWVIAVIALVAWRFDVASYRVRLRAPRPASRRLGALGIAVAGIAAAVVLRWNGGTLGFAVDAEDMEAALTGRIETEHFVIHYTPSLEIEADLALIAADHEFRYAQVVAQLGVEPDGKLVSFYFSDRDQKGRLHGSRNVEMAKPWRREIYVDHRGFPHNSLRHEIAHAIASEFGDPVWGVSTRTIAGIPLFVSPGLVEGLAVAVDWPVSYDRLNPHESMRVIQALGQEPSISSLLGLSFFATSSSKGYTTAGSFLRFLLDRYGPAKLRAVYRNAGDFEAAYGIPRARLEREWREMLATVEVSKSAIEGSKEQFRGGSVFAKPCPHAIAKRRERAAVALAEGDRERAGALLREVCSDAPEEPRYRISLGNFLAAGDDSDRAEARTLWTLVAIDAQNVTSTVRAQAFERLAQEAASRGELDLARTLVEAARTLPLAPNDRRQLDAMAFSFAHTGPAGPSLRNYFFPLKDSGAVPATEALAAVAAEPELGFAHYLLGLQRQNQGNWAAASKELQLALARELPNLAFVKNAARILAIASYRSKDRVGLAIATTVLSGSAMTSGDRLFAKDWLDRVAFDDRRAAVTSR